MRRHLVVVSLLLAMILLPPAGLAQTLPGAADHYFVSSDGVRLHYLQAGRPTAHTIIFIPGWTMPAWIWAPQLAAFAPAYRVVAFDPRGQGASAVASTGYEPRRRGQDIAELIERLGGSPVLLVGWSLGVLDALAYVHEDGDRRLAGLVLVDNSVGEPPAPRPPRRPPGRPIPHPLFMQRFVRAMFHTPQNPAWLDRLTEATLRTPDWAARALLDYPVPREYWRQAIFSTEKPVLYVVRPGFEAQAANLQRDRPNTETALFADAGHALFIDQAARFDALMASFIRRRVWP